MHSRCSNFSKCTDVEINDQNRRLSPVCYGGFYAGVSAVELVKVCVFVCVCVCVSFQQNSEFKLRYTHVCNLPEKYE